MPKTELRACPFCGSGDIEASTFDGEDAEGWPTAMRCGDCGAMGPWVYASTIDGFDHEMLKEWNTRPEEDRLRAALGEMTDNALKMASDRMALILCYGPVPEYDAVDGWYDPPSGEFYPATEPGDKRTHRRVIVEIYREDES